MKPKDVMNVAFLSLGGNLGKRSEILAAALQAITKTCGEIVKTSSVYETEAWGSSSQNKYLNQVIKLKTGLKPQTLLKQIALIEQQAGRKRKEDQNSDRILDIDILFFNNDIFKGKNLQVPHPRLHLRKFVLIPLQEIEKKLVHPLLHKNIDVLLKECDDKLAVSLYVEKISLTYVCIEGNIGSGKSTLAKALHKKWSALYMPEIFEENHLLPLFYTNPKPFAFSMEYSFLINRFEQITNILKTNKKLIVSDYSFYKSLWFAKVNLPKKEFRIFEKHFNTLAALLPKPDLIVYLDTSVKNLEKNIKKRARPYEQQMAPSYLKSIEKSYKMGMAPLGKIKKLTIPVKNYHPALESELTGIIENYIKENFGDKSKKPTFNLLK